jgi:mevalonate kinase
MTEKKTGVGMAAGKIILMGEHSVVYGEPAIAFPFQGTAVTATLTPNTAMTIDCHYYSGSLAQAPQQLENIKELIKQLLFFFKEETATFSLQITSTIPAERGMGSSAATAVAVVRSFFDYFNYAYTQEELLTLVSLSEKIAHGNPSGIDAAATSGSDPVLFIKGTPLRHFPMNLSDTYLVVADTGIKGQTRAAVKDIAHLFEQDKKAVAQKMLTLGTLTNQAKEAIIANDSKGLGTLMTLAHAQLQSLAVSNELLDQLVSVALEKKALGAKLTGGGRGGCMIALADSLTTAKNIAQALTEHGAVTTWIQSLEVKK